MAAWRFGWEDLPADVAAFVHPLPTGAFVLVSPNAPHHSVVIRRGWWIIQSEVGCLYAVPHKAFIRKYVRRVRENETGRSRSVPRRSSWAECMLDGLLGLVVALLVVLLACAASGCTVPGRQAMTPFEAPGPHMARGTVRF
jgi:hypothetical protein